LLKALALWCIRYTPITAVDGADGLILDASGCAHLWGGEQSYLTGIITRLTEAGYQTRSAMADTIGAAWAMARFAKQTEKQPTIIEKDAQLNALLPLPPAALRLEAPIIQRLQKLGLYRLDKFIAMPRNALRRRFGAAFLLRLDQALGHEEEFIEPVQAVEAYIERLPCLEPICTAGGIEIALERLLDTLCGRLQKEGKGLRTAIFSGYRLDGKLQRISIGTNRPTHNTKHLFKLFAEKISSIEPGLGIELFLLEAPKVEDAPPSQKTMWKGACDLNSKNISEMLDRIANKVGGDSIRRYLPDEHYWPERSVKRAASLQEEAPDWPDTHNRPIHLLSHPEPIEVTAPIPDYPPMLFRYKDILHKIRRADGPERIEKEWWIDNARIRDYYTVEDQDGARFWLFRSGHYTGSQSCQWFIHGFFA
jgi:protein ImuB